MTYVRFDAAFDKRGRGFWWAGAGLSARNAIRDSESSPCRNPMRWSALAHPTRRLRQRQLNVLDTVLLVIVWLGTALDVLALDIVVSYSGGFENRPTAVRPMERAASIWEAVLTDPIVLHIDVREVSIVDLPFGAQGSTLVKWHEERWPVVRDALIRDATSTNDRSSISHLPTGNRVSFRTWDSNQNAVINNGDDPINHWITTPRANFRALELPIGEDDLDPDASISWSNFFLDRVFDFDRSDGVDGTDFVGVALHEIGHVLGFSSGVDDIEIVHAGFVPGVTPDEINDYTVVRVLDLFRYSAESLPLTDLTPGTDAYFSIDGGVTSLGEFATGENFGDGWQAGHWRLGTGGIMDANLPDGAIHNLTRLDVQALDVIGWDVSPAFFGDFDGDGALTAADIYALSAAVRAGDHPTRFDLNLDQRVDDADRAVWVKELKRTYFGDANLDGQFNSGDLVAVFIIGKYESGMSAEWQDGDWNGDGQFNSRDFVVAFTDGGYEIGPRPAAGVVPEPVTCELLVASWICLIGCRPRE
jgi:hypothetical protein